MSTEQTARPRKARYLGPARRRPQVLDAALEAFAEAGYGNASMSAIARAAGTTKPVLYDCFGGGKRDLYLTLLAREEQRFTTHMEDVFQAARQRPFPEALEAGIRTFLDYAEVNPAGFRLIFGETGTTEPEIVRRTERVREGIIARLRDSAGADARTALAPVAFEAYTRAIIAVAEAMARWWLRDRPADRAALATIAAEWMMRGFAGIGRNGSGTSARVP